MSEPVGQRLINLYLAAALLGVVAALVHFAFPEGSNLYVIAGSLLDILIGVVVVLIAVRAKRTMDRAPLRASLAGAIFSLLAGIGDFLFPPSAQALRSAMLDEGTSLSALGGRIVELVGALVVGWLLALLVGWIASLFVHGGDHQAV